jgi:hypothetical protein
MAFNAADWSITRNGAALDVRYIGDAHAGASPSYSTTIELHRALGDFADDEVDFGDDELSIIDQTPSDRGGADTNITLLNGCNIDDLSVEHIYDGSITQAVGDTIYDGIQTFGNSVNIQIIQNGARIVNDFWNEPKMLVAVSDAASATTHRFLVKVRDAGADIDGRRLLGTQRELGTSYTEFSIGGGTNRGNNTLALTANSNLNNASIESVIALWTDIVNDVEGYTPIDADGNSIPEFYYSDWELGSRTKNNFYERAQWLQRRGTVQTLYGLPGDVFRGITHEIDIDTATGTFVQPEAVTWTGGSGQLLAINSVTAGTKMWIQLLSGVVPGDGVIITGTSGATAAVNILITPRQVSLPFIGASTGSAIIGAFGIGIGTNNLTQNEKLIDLTGTLRTPPNNVTYSVNNTIAGDYVISANNLSGNFDFNQLLTQNTYSGAAVTSIQMSAAIPTDIPSSGTFRILLDTGSYRRIVYSSFSGSTFTIPSTDFSGIGTATAGNGAFVTYIDRPATGTTETTTYVFSSPRTFFTRVRNATPGNEIKTFETTALVGSGGGASTVSRISDF